MVLYFQRLVFRYYNINLFRMDTGHRRVLAISTINKPAFQGACGVKCGKSAVTTVAVEVCPSTAPIR